MQISNGIEVAFEEMIFRDCLARRRFGGKSKSVHHRQERERVFE
jgi:hypothetical protein